jgi:hypothetical protein
MTMPKPEQSKPSGEELEPEEKDGVGWDQVTRQDEVHWPAGSKPERKEGISKAAFQDRHVSYGGPRPSGSRLHDAPDESEGPDSNWDLDDYRRTEFAGS